METGVKYVPLRGFVVPVYRFIEGEDEEQFWVDAQNCEYYTYNNEDFDEKNATHRREELVDNVAACSRGNGVQGCYKGDYKVVRRGVKCRHRH